MDRTKSNPKFWHRVTKRGKFDPIRHYYERFWFLVAWVALVPYLQCSMVEFIGSIYWRCVSLLFNISVPARSIHYCYYQYANKTYKFLKLFLSTTHESIVCVCHCLIDKVTNYLLKLLALFTVPLQTTLLVHHYTFCLIQALDEFLSFYLIYLKSSAAPAYHSFPTNIFGFLQFFLLSSIYCLSLNNSSHINFSCK